MSSREKGPFLNVCYYDGGGGGDDDNDDDMIMMTTTMLMIMMMMISDIAAAICRRKLPCVTPYGLLGSKHQLTNIRTPYN